jgi:hypothetical protein
LWSRTEAKATRAPSGDQAPDWAPPASAARLAGGDVEQVQRRLEVARPVERVARVQEVAPRRGAVGRHDPDACGFRATAEGDRAAVGRPVRLAAEPAAGAFASSARSDPSTPIATISPSTWNASRPARAAAVGAIASRPSTAHRSPRPIDATVVNGRAVCAG